MMREVSGGEELGGSPATERDVGSLAGRAAWIAVGSELLGTERLDTNSLRVTALLRQHGVELRRKAVVGDLDADLVDELRAVIGRFPLVLVSGGLGPTADDVTREAVARACGRELLASPAVVADIEAKFAALGRRMPEVNKRQAMVLAGAELLRNERGTAPGQRLEHAGSTIFLLPGPPRELEGILVSAVEPWLRAHAPGGGIETAVLKVACVPESEVEERLGPAYAELGRERITVLARPGEIRVELTASGEPERRRAELAAMRARVGALLGDWPFTAAAEEELEAVVGALLRARGATVATAESCTGGLVAARLTAVPGSSDYVLGGVVAYANAAKSELLGVAPEVLREHGAVSEPVARALAAGARARLGADWGIGVTGVAGPGGGSDEKPVGTVHHAVAGPGGVVVHRLARFPGDRERVRWQASQLGLELLRRALLRAAAEATPGVAPAGSR
jgi:nicotinamide-nucleotide amidase